jgi:hypothetical protein
MPVLASSPLPFLPCPGENIPNQRRPGVTRRVTQVDDEGQVAVVDGDAGNVDDARDALLFIAGWWSVSGLCFDLPWNGWWIYLGFFGELEVRHLSCLSVLLRWRRRVWDD